MTIVKKTTLLFSISFILMAIIGFWIDSINSNKLNLLIQQKYISVADNLIMHKDNPKYMKKLIEEYDLEVINRPINSHHKVLFQNNNINNNSIKIIQEQFEDEFLIVIETKDKILLFETDDEENLVEKTTLNILIMLDIVLLVIIYLFVLNLLKPLKSIALSMKKFSQGDLSIQINNNSNDEIGILANSFNSMAENIKNLIQTREELLRSIAHELRTPITKGKFIVEKVEDFEQKEIIKKLFQDLEYLTNSLLELEKLNTNNLQYNNFTVETLILESINKLYIIDEKSIHIDIKNNFMIYGDLDYLSIAIKNLIDNALKYTQKKPIEVVAFSDTLIIKNQGDILKKDIDFYTKPFTQEKEKNIGYGLGLSLVKKILDKHQFLLSYSHDEGINSFSIKTKNR